MNLNILSNKPKNQPEVGDYYQNPRPLAASGNSHTNSKLYFAPLDQDGDITRTSSNFRSHKNSYQDNSSNAYKVQIKGSSLKVSQRNGGGIYLSSDNENDYKLPSIKDMTTGVSSGLGILKSQGNKRLTSKLQNKTDDFQQNPLFTEDNPLFSDVSVFKRTPNISTRLQS